MHYKTVEEAKLMSLYHGVNVGHKGGGYPIYVYPESYHIFEPQDGDKNIDGYVFDAKIQAWKKIGVVDYEAEYSMRLPHELPINERNGKAFIMPERE